MSPVLGELLWRDYTARCSSSLCCWHNPRPQVRNKSVFHSVALTLLNAALRVLPLADPTQA